LKYFETLDIISWFYKIKNVPWIFINILCFIDRNLTISLRKSIKMGKLCTPSKSKRAFYNYMLLDANKFISLMSKYSGLTLGEQDTNFNDFKLFKSCIFYVGKGTCNRKNVHLMNGKKFIVGKSKKPEIKGQVEEIVNCWKHNGSIMIVQIEGDATTYEAHCREAAIIATLGLKNLSNSIHGVKYGEMKQWSEVKLRNYGEMTLFISFKNFILKRPPVVKASDVDVNRTPGNNKKYLVCKSCGCNL
jgi:hypothetical protein